MQRFQQLELDRATVWIHLATPGQGSVLLNYDDFCNVANCEAVF